MHLGRLLSILIGTCTLLAVYHMGRVLAPSRPIVALLAAGLVASVPGYTFIHSFMTNDTLVILFTTLSMSVALRIVREGPTRQLALLGGLFSGLTALSKLNGIWVAGIVWLAILLYALAHRKQKPLRSIFPPLMLSMGLWLALTGGWFAYGLSHGGDPLGIAIHASYTWQNPLRLMVPPPGQWLADLWEWDHYIWGNSTTWPEWIYAIFRGLYVIGLLLAGISALRAWKHRTAHSTSFQQGSFLSLAIALAWLGGLYWLFIYNWRFGRLLYPGLTSAAVLAAAGLAWGFHQLQALNLPRRIYSGAAAAILIGVLAASINGALNAIDTYRPDRVSPQALAGMQQTLLTFVDPADGTTPVATVTGYAIPNQDVRAGGVLTATICWKSDGYRRASFPYALQLVGPEDVQPGTRNSYHGLGNYPLATWKPGEEFCDPTSLSIGEGKIDKPRAYDLVLTLFEIEPPGLTVRSVLTAYDGQQRPVHPVISRVRVAPEQQPLVTPTVKLGNVAGLAGSTIELLPTHTLSVNLRWVALGTSTLNAKVFMHVIDKTTDKVIAQSDHEPDGGWFPTRYWQKGDVVNDQFEIPLPQGTRLDDVDLRLGMYDANSQVRLPAIEIGTQRRYADDAIPLTPQKRLTNGYGASTTASSR